MTFPTPPRLFGTPEQKLNQMLGWMYSAYKALIVERDIVEVDLDAVLPLIYTPAGRIIALSTAGASTDDILTFNGTSWVPQANGAGGDVQGPSLATVTEVAVFNVVTGKEIARVPVRIDSLGNITQVQGITAETATVNTSFAGTAFLDEDNFASNSDTKAASQQSIKAYVDTVAALKQPLDADLTALATAFTAASAAGPASLIFAEDTDNGTNKVTVSAPPALAGDVAAVLPSASGTILTTADIGSSIQAYNAALTAAASGTYTPTITALTNLDSVTNYQGQYMRVGDVVTVSGRVDANATAATTNTSFEMSLPIASDFAALNDCCGTAVASAVASQCAAIVGQVTNNTAKMQWVSGSTADEPMFFTFTYRII